MTTAAIDPAAVPPGARSYTGVAMFFHWLVVLAVFIQIPVGLAMVRVDRGPLQDALFITHKGLGAALILIIALRILWRLTHRPPPLTGVAPWQATAARTVHLLLYVMLVVMVVSGYVRTVAGGFPIELFNWLGIPPLMEKSKPVEGVALAIHLAGKYVLGALILAHIGAALHHLVIRRDYVFWTMWPGRAR